MQNVRDRMATEGQYPGGRREVVSCAATPARACRLRPHRPRLHPTHSADGHAAGVTAAVSQAILDAGATPPVHRHSQSHEQWRASTHGFVSVEDSVNLIVVDESQLSRHRR